MRLLVGLGNPGETYRETRHNIGWDLVLHIVRQNNLAQTGQRFKGDFGDGRILAHRLLWLLPRTYMNLSGESVGAAVRFYKLEPSQVIVVHDDMDLPLGKVRMKVGGGNAGHNGLKSIQQVLGTPDFVRIRLGIGRPSAGEDAARFVLNPFTAAERTVLLPLLDGVNQVLPLILEGFLPEAMNRLTLALTPKQPTPLQQPKQHTTPKVAD